MQCLDRICRVCLATDRKLYELCGSGLAAKYNEITSLQISVSDGMARYICNICYALLEKCSKFRLKCLETDRLLRQNIPRDYLLQMNRSLQQLLTTTSVSITSYEEHEKDEFVDREMIKEEIDSEFHHDEIFVKEHSEQVADVDNDLDSNGATIDRIDDENCAVDCLADTKDDKDDDKEDFEASSDDASEAVAETDRKTGKKKSLFSFTNLNAEDIMKMAKNTRSTNPNVKSFYRHVLDKYVKEIKAKTSKEVSDVFDDNEVKMENNTLENQYDVANASNDVVKKLFYAYLMRKYRSKAESSETVVANIETLEKDINKPNMKRNLYKYKQDLYALDRKMTPEQIETFEKQYMMKIDFLTKEEQILAVKSRQNKDLYRRCVYRCTLCYVGFQQEDVYKKHMLLHDPISGPHECEVCHTRFQTRRNIVRHTQGHRFKLTCIYDGCKGVFANRAAARQHFESHQGATFPCGVCDKVFTQYKTRLNHRRVHHGSTRCRLCHRRVGAGDKAMALHRTKMHRLTYTCQTCSTEFASQPALTRHAPRCGEGAPCGACGEAGPTADWLERHVEDAHTAKRRGDAIVRRVQKKDPPCQCDSTENLNTEAEKLTYLLDLQSGQVLTRQANESDDLSISNGATDQSKYLSICSPNCKHAVARRKELFGGKPRFICEICASSLTSAAALRDHQRVHTGERPHRCPDCPKGFRTKFQLQLHRNVHSGLRPYVCPCCGKAFSSGAGLYRHRLVHSGAHPYRCSLCPKAYQTRSGLQLHVRTRHLHEPWPARVHSGAHPYRCSLCPKAYQTRSGLQLHVRTRHLHEPWPARVHSGAHPYRCSLCPQAYQTRSGLRLHVRTRHLHEPWPARVRHRKGRGD